MFLPRAEYDRLVLQLETAVLELRLERIENRRAERHMTNMLLRRAGTFPVPPATPEASVTTSVTDNLAPIPPVDPGERRALIEAGAAVGVSAEDVDQLLELERIRGTG